MTVQLCITDAGQCFRCIPQPRGNVRIIQAEVPLAEMFGYTTILRGLTQGRASSTMEPSEYRQMPDRLRDEVLARA